MLFLIIPLAAIVITSLVLCLFLTVPTDVGVVISNQLSGALRSVGPGFRLLWPWERILDKSGIPLTRTTVAFESNLLTLKSATISLTISVELMPMATHLVNYTSFATDENRQNSIQAKVQAILFRHLRLIATNKESLNSLDELAQATQMTFNNGEAMGDSPAAQYHGTRIVSLMIFDTTIPPILSAATIDAGTSRT